jgi:hypothetical protein
MEARWKQQAAAEEARHRTVLAAMPAAELREAIRAQERIDRAGEQARQAPRSGPGPG